MAALLAGCASSQALRRGREAERRQDYDRAVAEYTTPVREDPDNAEARLALQRTKLRAADAHFNRGRRFAAGGRLDEALVEYQIASELNPASGDIEAALQETRNQARARVAVAREGKTALESLIERTRRLPSPGLELPKELKLPASLVFRDASSRDVFTAIARFADVNVVFDPAFREAQVTIDLRDATLENALAALTASTRNFYQVTAPRAITIIPDTPAKRREYEEEVVRTFYLSNADLKETIDLLRMVVDLRRLAPITATNAISIKDTPERIAGGRAADRRHRQGAPRGRDRRRAARGRSHAAARVRHPGRLAGHDEPRGRLGTGGRQPGRPHAARRAEPHAGRGLPHRAPGPLLPPDEERHQHPHPRQPAAARVGRAWRRRRGSASACRCR